MNRKDIEITAPAGSYESLTAAIQGGADSVYFGAEQLNMRAASSNNFTVDDLGKISAICRENGLKSYLTLNVVVFDKEIEQMKRIVDSASEAGISAIIASDPAVIQYAFSRGISIHLSTQLNISNIESLRFFSQWAGTAVLARELSLEQVKGIADEIANQEIRGPGGELFRLELFAHGALCMATSGKCYLSLHEYNKSANRGECYQICRRGYEVRDRETGYELAIDNEYIMSPRDLSTIGFLDKVLGSGISILKIEGRARSAEYVRVVSSCYDEAVRAVAEGSYTQDKIDNWNRRLSQVFNRGFWDGYYLGRRMGEWTDRYGSSASRRKVYLGKITNYFTKLNVAEIKLETGNLTRGDSILIIGPTTGMVEFTVGEIRVDLKETDKALKGEFCSIRIDSKLRRSDKVFRWDEAERRSS